MITLSIHNYINQSYEIVDPLQRGANPMALLLCEFCSSAHYYKSYFKHMMTKHMEEVSKIWIKCKICNYYRPSQMAIDGHVASVHPDYHNKIMRLKRELGMARISTKDERRLCFCDFCKEK